MRLQALLLLTSAACTVVSDSYQPRQVEALLGDAGNGELLLDAGVDSIPTEPGPIELAPTEPTLSEPTLPAPLLSPADAGASCSGTAESGGCELPQPASCSDSEQNQGETDADCGGPCAPCNDDQSCAGPQDCLSAFCTGAGRCALATCGDGERNGAEVGPDCGGPCPACAVGTPCSLSADCITGVCQAGACAAATCSDQVLNQDEIDRDCGGSCGACLPGARCNQASDCGEGVCQAQGCTGGAALCCQPARCNDGVQNGNEPVRDCGAAPCQLCPLQSPCSANAQCGSNRCLAGRCAPPPCVDGVQNGNESDEDCGGTDPTCVRCAIGQECNTPADCASGSCLGGRCADCDDDDQGGDETDTDCGGSCGPCATGQDCEADADCASGACVDDRCCGGQQADCTRCARRLVTNINCGTSGAAGQPTCDAFLQCLQENVASCPNRLAASCTAAGAVCDPALFGGNGSPGIVQADSVLGTARCTF
ncbi:MAG: hypothetical protein RL685_5381 [Pseudomonadota bacterium]|jgi:hypothetical protein